MLIKEEVIKLRELGKTYGEIRQITGKNIAKSTLSYWCRSVPLPKGYEHRVKLLMSQGCSKGRATALLKKQEIKNSIITGWAEKYKKLVFRLQDREIALIALAMLCLGEASKGSSLYIGSSDDRIITLFLRLLKRCFPYDEKKIRCTVQCRADQNVKELEQYWRNVTGLPRNLFYSSRVDARTTGKRTIKVDYKGVLRIDYFDSRIQGQLKVIYDLLSKDWKGR